MRLCVVWILGGLLLATHTQAETLHVTPGGLYPTIQAGIDSAVVGDTLVIAAGTWTENPLILRKDLVLMGEPGKTVIIDAGPNSNHINSGAVLRTVSSRVKVRNLTLRNGRTPVGAAIFMFGGTIDLRHCKVEDNLFGILAVSGLINLIIVEDCEFLRNDIGIQGSTATRVVRTRFEGGRLAFLPIGQCELIDVEVRLQRRAIVGIAQDAVHGRDQKVLRRIKFGRKPGGDGVGVDVENVAIAIGRKRANHRHAVAVQQMPQDADVDRFDVADVPEIDAARAAV